MAKIYNIYIYIGKNFVSFQVYGSRDPVQISRGLMIVALDILNHKSRCNKRKNSYSVSRDLHETGKNRIHEQLKNSIISSFEKPHRRDVLNYNFFS